MFTVSVRLGSVFKSLESVLMSHHHLCRFQVNILGTFLSTKAFIPLLIKNDKSMKTIMNITSISGLTKFANCSAYQMSKFALMRFSELCNAEYSEKGLLNYVRSSSVECCLVGDRVLTLSWFEPALPPWRHLYGSY